MERHHNRKVDAPSGTALMIADAAASALECKAEYNFGRHERRMARPKNEIGISAVRGGTIVGDHTIIFAGHDEVIEIKHSAQSREILRNGAVGKGCQVPGRRPGGGDVRYVPAGKRIRRNELR